MVFLGILKDLQWLGLNAHSFPSPASELEVKPSISNSFFKDIYGLLVSRNLKDK